MSPCSVDFYRQCKCMTIPQNPTLVTKTISQLATTPYQAFGEDLCWAAIKLLFLLWPHLLFEGKGFYCPQDKG